MSEEEIKNKIQTLQFSEIVQKGYKIMSNVEFDSIVNGVLQLQQENSQLKQRIEKAIEIINQMIFNGYAKGGTIYMATSEKSEFGSRAKIILEILKGDKE